MHWNGPLRCQVSRLGLGIYTTNLRALPPSVWHVKPYFLVFGGVGKGDLAKNESTKRDMWAGRRDEDMIREMRDERRETR